MSCHTRVTVSAEIMSAMRFPPSVLPSPSPQPPPSPDFREREGDLPKAAGVGEG
jgi:hypothetical protein